eukprot:CAMPEP_0172491132 /NCGR_PEP_ID=MMETSP1066-20121228/21832_1 /TAXON_ID=671091 /ORGANISM="Coscinodiscus wailesii, Strain CCMP2513" /LENGTH=538 /DNA_ID=CAMNT_0013260009 /DNA_START=220 /DNA_END=1836 /DNA_ORIENTATION=+
MALASKRRAQDRNEQQRKRKLHSRLLANAKPMPSSKSVPEFMRNRANSLPGYTRARRLADDDNDDYYDDAAGDDAAAVDDDADYGNFGFDVTQYSLKYARCAAIERYSDDLAQDEDSSNIFITQRFVVFRLCPSDYCYEGSTFGCDNNFGDYIIPLDEYLEAKQEYNEEQQEAYCDFCEECMKDDRRRGRRRRLDEAEDADEGEDEADEDEDEGEDEEANEENEGDNDDEDQDEGDDEEEEEEEEDDDEEGDGDNEDDAGAGDDAADDAYDGQCEYYNECYNYENTCEDNDNDDGYIDYDDFLECVKYENENGEELYIGPHCASDGATLVLGLYQDEDCSYYVGDNYDISDFTGLNIQDDGLAKYYSGECINCKQSELAYQNQDENDDDDNAVSEICENLFDQSAKCHKFYNNPVYMSEEQENNANMVCYFIDNVLSGSYDEYGQIVLSNDDIVSSAVNFSPDDISTTQLTFIGVSLLACIFLIGYSCYLHRAITRKAPWRPRRGGPEALAGQISRQNSGIVMGRSRSGGSYHGGSLA